jgi:hypothetical protein
VPQVDKEQWRVAAERGCEAGGALIADALAEEKQLVAPVDGVAPVPALYVGQLAPLRRRQADEEHKGADGAHRRLKIGPPDLAPMAAVPPWSTTSPCPHFGSVDEFGQAGMHGGSSIVAASLSIAATSFLVVASAARPDLALPPHTLIPVRAAMTGLQAAAFLLGVVWTHDGPEESIERRRLRAAYDFLGTAIAICSL